MKIACNYYRETEELFYENKIDIDYFKYPGVGFQLGIMKDLNAFNDFCSRVTKKRPILLHGLYPAPHDLSSISLQKDFNDEIADRLIRVTKTPGLSFHPALSELPADIPFNKTLDIIINNAKYLKEKYDYMQFVSVENCDSANWGDLIKPEVISQIINESGCDFLLDISHAFCASRLLNISLFDYLKRLPLDKTVEIHINGWVERNNSVMCHTKINRDGYRALEFVLEYCIPDIITVEYGRHNDKIGAGVPLMSLENINEQAKEEIEEQICKVREICIKRNI
ncbi:MAG: DUF692 family protein [Clostridiales bacterium]|nr:DUF692 family protein [Clostridiales bacterium]